MTDADYIARWKADCIVRPSGCWDWQKHCDHFRNMKPGQRGYPTASYRNKRVRLNRKMLELRIGRTLKPGMQACHRCDYPPCINPDHLYEATNQQNHLDGGKRKRMQGQLKTHCKSGHEFTPENTYWSKRGVSHCRNCLRCKLIRMRIEAGWTREQAESLPKSSPGQRPVNARWHSRA